jgi:hypothetical protein
VFEQIRDNPRRTRGAFEGLIEEMPMAGYWSSADAVDVDDTTFIDESRARAAVAVG